MQDVRIFARLPDGTLRVAVHAHDAPGWSWLIAGPSGPSALNGDVVLSVASVADLPAGPTHIGVV
jgi:hypothetical protein